MARKRKRNQSHDSLSGCNCMVPERPRKESLCHTVQYLLGVGRERGRANEQMDMSVEEEEMIELMEICYNNECQETKEPELEEEKGMYTRKGEKKKNVKENGAYTVTKSGHYNNPTRNLKVKMNFTLPQKRKRPASQIMERFLKMSKVETSPPPPAAKIQFCAK